MDFPAANPKVGASAEILEAFFEILRSKAQVSIELHDEIPIVAGAGRCTRPLKPSITPPPDFRKPLFVRCMTRIHGN